MPYYSLGGFVSAAASSNKGTAATWTVTATLKRHKWYEIIIGATGNPNATDTYIQVDVQKIIGTTSIAGTTGTIGSLDSADGSSIITSLVNMSTEPNANQFVSSGNASMMTFGLNQRNTTRWIAAQESQYLVAPATNLNGFYMRVNSNAYTGSVATMIYWNE